MNDKDYFRKLWNESPMGRSGCCTPVAIAVFVGVLFMLCSCATRRSIEYVDREVVKYQKEVVHDTLIQHTHDSVYHTILQKGDTVFDTKYVEKTKYRDRVVVKTDTCYRDSIQTVIKENVKETQIIPKWCYISLLVCGLFIIFAIIKVIKWVRTL